MVPRIVGILTAVGYSSILTWVILEVLDATMGPRVDEGAESLGHDLSEHAETAYIFQ